MNAKKVRPKRAPGVPLTEEEIERRRRARRRREMKKRRRRRLTILAILAVVVIVAMAFLIKSLVGKISGSFFEKAEETTLTLESDGSLIFEEISELGEEYDASKLSSFAKAQIKAFDVDENSYVRLEATDVEGNTAYIRTKYSDTKVYSRFTGYEIYFGTVSGAKSAGYDFSTTFNQVKTSGGENGEKKTTTSPVNRSDVISKNSDKVLIIRENVKIKVFGDIEYVSTEGTEVGPDYVKSKSVGGNDDAAVLTYIIFKDAAEE